MKTNTTVYLGVDDLNASAISPVFTSPDGEPWATVTLGDAFGGSAQVVLHNDPGLGANPLHVAATLERLAAELRLAFARWISSSDSDQWVAVRDAIATAEAITQANAKRVA